jgi:hypothetical protein
LTLLTLIKDPSLRGLRGNQDRQKFDFCPIPDFISYPIGNRCKL